MARAFPNLKRLAWRGNFDEGARLWAHPLIRRLHVLALSGIGYSDLDVCWTHDALHLASVCCPINDEVLEVVATGPPIKQLVVPFDDAEDLEFYIAGCNESLGELIDAAWMRGARLTFAGRSTEKGFVADRWESYPAAFLRAVP